jgi:hypothetical protein
LPLCFDGKEACLEMSSLIASLSKLAFNALFTENRASSLVFKQDEIIKEGLKHEEIELSKQIGLLSVSQVPGRSVIHRFQCFTFPHKSIQEYLSAVHLSDIISETDPLNEQIKKGFGSRIMLIHNAIVLKFLCGINLEKAVQVSKYIAESMGGDQNISYYRKHMQDQPQFNEHYVAQCDPSVTEYQDVLYDCIREGKACGKNKLNFHVSDLDININTKIRSVLDDLDMSSLVTLRIHDDISAIENHFLNKFLRQQCADLRCVVLENISLTLSQFEKVMLKTVTLKLDHVNFYDVKGHDDSLEDYQFDKVHTKVRELVISNVQLSCVWLTKLLSVVFKASDLRILDLHCIRCISPCVRQWHTTKDRVAVQEMPMLTQLKLEDNEFPRDILDFFAVLLMYSKQLKKIQLQNIKSNLVCSCMSLHLYKAVNFETLVCTASKQICFRNLEIGRGPLRDMCSILSFSEVVELHSLAMSTSQMEEILSHIAVSSSLKKMSICKVDCLLSDLKDDDVLDFELVMPVSPLPEVKVFELIDVKLTHIHMEMILSILARAVKFTEVHMKDVKCQCQDEYEDTCVLNKIKQVLHKKVSGVNTLSNELHIRS